MAACELHDSKLADPRSVITHRFSWAQLSKGCKTLTSYWLEAPALSHPSLAGLRSPHVRRALTALTEVNQMPLNLGDAEPTESHSWVWCSAGATEMDWEAPRDRASETTDVPAVGQPGGTQGGTWPREMQEPGLRHVTARRVTSWSGDLSDTALPWLNE